MFIITAQCDECCMKAVTMHAKACNKLPLFQCTTNASKMLEMMRTSLFIGKSGLITLDENEDRVLTTTRFVNYWLQASVFLALSTDSATTVE